MQNIKKVLAIFIVFVFVVGQFPLAVTASELKFDIIDGTPVTATPPAQLGEGEIWTGKTVEYHGDGTATITLLAWGSTYTDSNGYIVMPLAYNNEYVIISDNIGEFSLDAALLPSGVTFASNAVTWKVHQSYIVGAAPAQVSYVVFLDEGITLDRWYSTGIADVIFYPAVGNLFYWTRSETVQEAFSMDNMNWNNGNGLNGGTIVDNILGITITFGGNDIPANRTAEQTPYPSSWNNNATAGGQTFRWHLQWANTAPPQTYIFTVRDLGGSGIDVIYEAILPRPGGHDSIPGGRTIVSVNYFHRSGFNWDGDAIVGKLDAVAQIMLKSIPIPVGYLRINKVFDGWFDPAWGIDGSTQYHAVLFSYDGLYMEFEATEGINHHAFVGFVGSREEATTITFSPDSPAVIAGIPVLEPVLFMDGYLDVTTKMIETKYCFGEDGFTLTEGEITDITVTSKALPDIGQLEIRKILGGYPEDWDVDDYTIFNAKVWDTDGYLLAFEKVDYNGEIYVYQVVNFGDEYVEALQMVSFSVHSPAFIIGLPTGDHEYIVEEIFEDEADHITTTVTFDSGIVTVLNEYARGDSSGNGNSHGNENGSNGSNGDNDDRTPPDTGPPGSRPDIEQSPPDDADAPGFFTGDHVWFVRGYEDTEMRPDNFITRAEAAMVFFRLLRPELRDFVPESPFVDVVGDEWYGLAISTVAYHGILYGFDSGEFMPQLRFSRNEFTKVFPGGNPFYGFDAGAYLTRAEFVMAVNRMLKRRTLLERIPSDVFRFPDLNEIHWAYADFMEAAHTHTFERLDDGTEVWIEIIETGLNAPYNK